MRRLSVFFSLFVALLLSGCGYNAMQAQDEQIKAAWAEVLNQYQRRADLVPNLVNVVKGYAAHEKEVLTQVTEARAQVGSIKATPELINDPAAFAQFQQAQAQMTSALSRLLAVSENYPTLKADGAFRDLQAQLEGTENRVTVARNRFIKAANRNGIHVFRVFDALNDIKNLTVSINAAKKEKAHVQVAISYTTGPVFTNEYYVDYAKRIEAAGADSICPSSCGN